MGCDVDGCRHCRCSLGFNPRTHMGCDVGGDGRGCDRGQFQSTHPRGVRLNQLTGLYLVEVFQSTHPRGVRRKRYKVQFESNDVSIHAPTWGATTFWCVSVEIVAVSIHAPTWGATLSSRSETGAGTVSIHAPTWGATTVFQLDRLPRLVSIHAPTWGATCCCMFHAFSISLFQSTHPRGVRQDKHLYD